MSSQDIQTVIYIACMVVAIWAFWVAAVVVKEGKEIYKDSDWVIDIVNGKPIKKEIK